MMSIVNVKTTLVDITSIKSTFFVRMIVVLVQCVIAIVLCKGTMTVVVMTISLEYLHLKYLVWPSQRHTVVLVGVDSQSNDWAERLLATWKVTSLYCAGVLQSLIDGLKALPVVRGYVARAKEDMKVGPFVMS